MSLDEAGNPATDLARSHIAIVGAGHAGGRVAQHLRDLGHQGRISLIGDEAHAPYERPALSKSWLTDADAPWTPSLDGSAPAAPLPVALGPADFWDSSVLRDASIDRHVAKVIDLDADARTLTLTDKQRIAFDQLVVATGGSPRDGGIPGAQLPGVHVLRTIEDSLALRADLAKSRGLVIIGAGVIGMEVASSAVSLGIPVTVIEAGKRILARCLPPALSGWLMHEHIARGVHIHLHTGVSGITQNRSAANAPAASDLTQGHLTVNCHSLSASANAIAGEGIAITADTVLIAIGVDCRPAFLASSGLCGTQGVDVDAFCRSPAAPWLYAAGDVAHVMQGGRQETWRNAENQARLVAENLLGANKAYAETQWMWSDQHGFNIQVVGQPDASDVLLVRGTLGEGPAVALLVRDDIVKAGVLIDAGRERRFVEKLVASGRKIDPAQFADGAVTLRELAA